jgi:hypothetical protein
MNTHTCHCLFTLKRGKTVASQYHVLPLYPGLYTSTSTFQYRLCINAFEHRPHLSRYHQSNSLHITLISFPSRQRNHSEPQSCDMFDLKVAQDVPDFAMLWLPPFPSKSATNPGLMPFHMWNQPGIHIVGIEPKSSRTSS